MNFEYYENLVQDSIEQSNNLVNQSTALTGQAKIDILNQALVKVDESKNLMGEMQNSLIFLSTNERSSAQRKMQLFNTRIKEIEGRIETNKQKAKLFSNANMNPLVNQESPSESLSKTQNAIGSACEIGKGIISTLRDQHDKLMNAKTNADAIKASVANTATHVSRMERVAKQNKLIVYIVIGLLVIAILLLLYIKF